MPHRHLGHSAVLRQQARHHLAHQHAQRVHVHARVQLRAIHVLGSDVRRRPVTLLRLREGQVRHREPQPVVRHLQHVRQDEDVLRLHVRVRPEAVRPVQRRRHLRQQRLHFLQREQLPLRRALLHHPAQREPFQQLHCEEGPVPVHALLVHAHQVGVVELLAHPHGQRELRALLGLLHQPGLDDLQRHLHVDGLVLRAEDEAQRPGAYDLLDGVAVRDDVARLVRRALSSLPARRPRRLTRGRVELLATRGAGFTRIGDMAAAAVAEQSCETPEQGRGGAASPADGRGAPFCPLRSR